MEDLSKIAPKLSKIKKEKPFGVPHGYFDDFNARLQAKIEAKEKSGIQRKTIIRYLKPVIGIAASLAIIFMLVYWPLNKFNSSQTANTDTDYLEFSLENEYIAFLEELDANAFLAVLESEIEEEAPISEEGLISYLSANLSVYDILYETEY